MCKSALKEQTCKYQLVLVFGSQKLHPFHSLLSIYVVGTQDTEIKSTEHTPKSH